MEQLLLHCDTFRIISERHIMNWRSFTSSSGLCVNKYKDMVLSVMHVWSPLSFILNQMQVSSDEQKWCVFVHFWLIGFISVSSAIPSFTYNVYTHTPTRLVLLAARSSTDTSSVPGGLCHRRKRMINIPAKLDFQGLSQGLVLGPSSLMNFLSFHTSF